MLIMPVSVCEMVYYRFCFNMITAVIAQVSFINLYLSIRILSDILTKLFKFEFIIASSCCGFSHYGVFSIIAKIFSLKNGKLLHFYLKKVLNHIE